VTIIDLKTKRVLGYKSGELKSLGITKEYATVKFDDGSKIDTEGTEPNTFHLSQIALKSVNKINVSDLISMDYINEPEIGNTLKNRYDQDDMYTYCGETLITVNPYADSLQLFTPEVKQSYKKHLQSSFYMMQKTVPHVYSLALGALHEVIYDERPERKVSLCLTGESGGGKTQAGIQCTDFLMFCFNESPQAQSIESKV
jgi:myosin heavy subunit